MVMNKKIATVFLFCISILACVNCARAYIDAGTGSMLLGAIGPMIGIILAAIGAFFLKYFIKPVKTFFMEHKIIAFSIVVIVIAALVFLLFYLLK